MKSTFYQRVIKIIKQIPQGRVATYGQIARHAGNPRAARGVAYILHSSSTREKLPWHRVINSKGIIALKPRRGFELQKQLLEKEGVIIDQQGHIELKRFLWLP